MEMLQAELIRIKCELASEKEIRREQEKKFQNVKKLLQSKFDEIKEKNKELSKIIQKVQKIEDQQNDCEFQIEMYKEKYKKREKELLDSLKEARDQLKSYSNNTDENNQIICTDESSISVDIKVFLAEFKNQLSILKSELEFEQPMSVIKKMFNEVKKLNEEMLVNCTDCSDDLQEFLNVLKYMFDLSSIMLSDDTVILDLEKEKRQFDHKEKTYELLISKQDEEIKHLSQNILQYMNELAFHKNEVTKYKDIAKSESSLQTDLDFSIMTTDTTSTTYYDINNDSIFNESELILKSDQYVQTEEDILGLVQSKDKEIEDLSDKIMKYIDQLSALKQELNQLKSLSNSDQSRVDDELVKEKDDKITELTTTVHKYNEKINKYISELQSQKDRIKEKDTEIEDLSDNIMNYLSEINDLNIQLQSEKNLLNTKDEEIKNLSNKINIYNSQLSSAEEKIKILELASTTQDEAREKQIIDLTEKVTSYSKQLKEVLEEFDKYKSDVQTEQSLVDMKNKEIEELKMTLSNIKEDVQAKLSLVDMKNEEIEDLKIKLSNIKDDVQTEQSLVDMKNKEIEELKIKLSNIKEDLQTEQSLVDMKNKEIEELKMTLSNIKEDVQAKLSLLDMKNEEIEELKIKLSIIKEDVQSEQSLVDMKNKEIEELQITLSNIKENVQAEQSLVDMKNKEIEELKIKLSNIKEDVQTEQSLVDIKNKEIEELKIKLSDFKEDVQAEQSLVDMKNKEIEELKIKLSNIKEELHIMQTEMNINQIDLNETKDKLKELIAQPVVITKQLSVQEELRIDTSADNDLIQVTDEITELTEVKFSSEQLSVQENYAAIIEARDIEIREKNKGIMDLSSKLNEYEIKLIATENELRTYKSNMEREISMQAKNYIEKQELETRLSVVEKELQKYKLVIQKEKDSTQIIELSETMYAVQNELEKYKNIITTKDKKIQEILGKLSAAENEIWNCKSNADIDRGIIESKNLEINEMKTSIINYINQLTTADAVLKEYESDLKIQKDLTEAKTKEFDKLSDNIFDYVHKLSTTETNLEKYKNDLKNLKELLNHKDREIKELSSTAKEEIKSCKTNLENQYAIIEVKNKKIEELSSQIMDYIDQLSTIELQLYKSSEETTSKNKEVQELTSKIVYYEEQLISTEEKVKNYKSNIEKQIELLDSKTIETEDLKRKSIIFEDLINELEKLTELKSLEIQELNSKLLYCENQIQEYHEGIGNINSEEANSEYLKAKQDLEHANKTISELRNDLSQIGIIEELLTKSKLDVKKAQRLLQLKETEIIELSEKINLYRNLVSSKDEEFIKYETQLKEDQNIIKLKDQEIMNITGQLIKYENEIYEKDKIINDYRKDLELEKDINKRTEKRIQNIREEYSNQNAKFEEEIDNLKSSLNEKNEIVVYRENDIKSLNDKICQYAKNMQELNLHNETLTQVSSKYEILKMKIKSEEVKSIEYVNKIITLEQQIVSVNDQAKQMKQEYEVVQTSNLQYSTMIKNLQTQICAFEELITQQEGKLKQVESEKNRMIECNTLLRNTSLTEIQKSTDKLREQSKHIANLQMEIVTLQSMHDSNSNLTEEIADLKKKNEDYNKKFQQVTDKANSKICSYNNMVVKLKQDQELLKIQLTAEKETYRTTHKELVALQNEMKKIKSGLSDSDVVKLQTKIKNLEETNKQLIQSIENHQEKIHMKINECSAMKETTDQLKYENLNLHKITKNLNDKLCETEELLKSAKINVHLLEKEKENYNESYRNLQESLNNVKYELYELKNKERENLSSFVSSKSNDTKSSDSKKCKQRMPLADIEIDEQHDKVSELQNENEKLRERCDHIQNLCRLRENKIEDLERQIRSYSNQ